MSPWRTFGEVALHHQRLAHESAEQFEHGVEIVVARPDAEDARSAVAVERLHHDLAVFGAEGADRFGSLVISVGGIRSGNS